MILIGNVDEHELISLVKQKNGSIVVYFGYVRGDVNCRAVHGMRCSLRENSYELMERIEREIREKFRIEDVILYHSIGNIKIGGLLAAVIISSVHRKDGFAACRYGIDRIKEIEPVEREEY